jgi:hypothetical protein
MDGIGIAFVGSILVEMGAPRCGASDGSGESTHPMRIEEMAFVNQILCARHLHRPRHPLRGGDRHLQLLWCLCLVEAAGLVGYSAMHLLGRNLFVHAAYALARIESPCVLASPRFSLVGLPAQACPAPPSRCRWEYWALRFLGSGWGNPSLSKQLFGYAILGFALSEAMALFALLVAFLILFVLAFPHFVHASLYANLPLRPSTPRSCALLV